MAQKIQLQWMQQTGRTLERHATQVIELEADNQVSLFCLVYKEFKSVTYCNSGHYEFVNELDKKSYETWKRNLSAKQSLNLHYLGTT